MSKVFLPVANAAVRIVDLLVGHLQALRATKVPPWARKTITDGTVHPDDREMYMFYLRSFSNIILNSSNNVWSALAGPVKWIGKFAFKNLKVYEPQVTDS